MFSDRNRNALQIGAIMFAMNIGCKALGFGRQMLLANCFGTGAVVDAYIMAQSIPNILLGGVLVSFATAYMPLLSRIYETKGRHMANEWTSQIMALLFFLSAIVTLLGGYCSEEITRIAAPGLSDGAILLTSFFLKFTFGYTFFAATVGILSSYLQYVGIFTGQILGDYIQNLLFIIFIWIAYVSKNYLLIFGPFLGYAFRWFYLYILAKKRGFAFLIVTDNLVAVLREVLGYAFPVFLGTTAFEVNAYVDKYLASRLGGGSISALGYAHQLSTVAMELTVTILATIIFPKMLKAASRQENDKLSGYIFRGLDLCVIIAVPLSVGCMVYSREIIKIIFERGAFLANSTSITAGAFLFYSVGTIFLAVITVVTKVYYAFGDMKSPMICAGIGVTVNIFGDIALVDAMGINGLALATSIAAFFNFVTLTVLLRKKYLYIEIRQRVATLLKVIIATMISIGSGYFVFHEIEKMSFLDVEVLFIFLVTLSIVVYVFILKILRLKEINNILRLLAHGEK